MHKVWDYVKSPGVPGLSARVDKDIDRMMARLGT
jgi:hypothetical protein